MYQTYNMGHRFELYVPESAADVVVQASRRFNVDARVIGRCEAGQENRVVLNGEFGSFEY